MAGAVARGCGPARARCVELRAMERTPHPVERTEWTPPTPGALYGGLHSPLGADDVVHSHPVERATMRRCTTSSAQRTTPTDGDGTSCAGRERSPLPHRTSRGTVRGVSVVVAECVKGKRRRSRGNSWVDKGCFPSDELDGIRRHTWSRGVHRVHLIRCIVTLCTHIGWRTGVAATPTRAGGACGAARRCSGCGAPVRWGVHGLVGGRAGAPDAPHRAHRMPGCSALPRRVERTEWTARSAPPWSPLPSVHGAR